MYAHAYDKYIVSSTGQSSSHVVLVSPHVFPHPRSPRLYPIVFLPSPIPAPRHHAPPRPRLVLVCAWPALAGANPFRRSRELRTGVAPPIESMFARTEGCLCEFWFSASGFIPSAPKCIVEFGARASCTQMCSGIWCARFAHPNV